MEAAPSILDSSHSLASNVQKAAGVPVRFAGAACPPIEHSSSQAKWLNPERQLGPFKS